jgi:phage shock protein PspC (stress-responsive transcriptional regulator)
MSTRLERSTTNRVVGGVCAGLGDYLDIDPTLVRVFFVIGSVLTGGLGVLAYIVLLVIMPLPGRPAPFVKTDTDPAAESGVATTTSSAATPSDPEAAERRRAAFGFFLIALGVIFLFGNAGVFRIIRWDLVWPLVFVAMGALLLSQRIRR